MKNCIILIYLIFIGFISFNNYIISEKGYQNNFKYQNFRYNNSNNDFVSLLPFGKQNHKLNHHDIFKSESAYLNDVTSISKLIAFPVYKIFSVAHMKILKQSYFYHMGEFLPIFTQSDKTIQSEYLII
ncbi:MAG: hypothetical protein WCE54_15855 [Ignavibacteriaceae bacterium]